ncbi:MAG: hypothetical protein NTW15_14700 [Burkholderiales bacterium]|nr:hypothetical protein [Burkholderiales bacterium]
MQASYVATPRTLTLMAGPIDVRVNPTEVNRRASGKPIAWFERNMISTVPLRWPGAMRRVYPGFVQISAFMSMTANRHRKAFEDLYRHLVDGDAASAETIKVFYEVAQDLCGRIRPDMRQHHVQVGVGHYGVFNGKRWENAIYPVVREFVFAHG